MKQYITVEQLNELESNWEKDEYRVKRTPSEKLEKWCRENGYAIHRLESVIPYNGKRVKTFEIPLLSIGQMIEFLGRDSLVIDNCYSKDGAYIEWRVDWDFRPVIKGGKNIPHNSYQRKELCDALWLAVKDILESR